MDSTLMWLLVPHIPYGFGYMLVFVSVFEFICAQAPFRLKGVSGMPCSLLNILLTLLMIISVVINRGENMDYI